MCSSKEESDLWMTNEEIYPKRNSSGYFIDQERFEEMVRLNRQGRLITKGMGGVLAEQASLDGVHAILDLACGPGEWALQVAQQYPEKRVVGVDLSERMIEYAIVQAVATSTPVIFKVMNITRPLDLPAGSFDLVNIRMIMGFLKKEGWPDLLKECFRLLRPGGLLRVTEAEAGISTSPVIDVSGELWIKALRKAGQIFSDQEQHHMGVTVVLKRLLVEAGYVMPQHAVHALDYSFGTDAHETTLEDFIAALQLGTPFLVQQKVATEKQIQEIREQLRALVGKKDFCAYWFFMTVWAQKPESASKD